MPQPDAVPAVIQTRDLSVDRVSAAGVRVRAIDGLDLRIAPGGALTVFGAAGSGKSTLAQVLAGAEGAPKPAGGQATVAGVRVARRGRAHRQLTFRVGYVAQGAAAVLPARLNVTDIVASPITDRDRRADPHAVGVRVGELLDELRLPVGTAVRYPYELSTGMRQRVAVARALMAAPRVLIADDPFAGLDERARDAVGQALARRRTGYGMAMLLLCNDVRAVRELRTEVLVLSEGRAVAVGPDPAGLVWTPGAESAARLIAF